MFSLFNKTPSVHSTNSSSIEKNSQGDVVPTLATSTDLSSDEADLARMGYRQDFKREFTNLSTISFAFSIMGVASSVATTFNVPLFSGGPASVVWCWFIGMIMCIALGTSIGEIVSAYPTNGGLYSASAYLVPRRYRAPVGWVVGWLNLLGQCAGVASTEFGLSGMILSAATIATDGNYQPTQGHIVGLFIVLLIIHGLLNSLATRALAMITKSFVFVNLGAVFIIIVALLITTPDKHDAAYIFTNVNNQSGWDSDGIAFLLGLLSVQWTMTDYDATAHICEEVKRASIAAPVAIVVAVLGTGLIGWVYNVVLVMCSGDITMLDPTTYVVSAIIANNVGKQGFYAIWSLVCFTAFAVVTTALQANARTFHAFSRDRGFPRIFAKMSSNQIPVYSVWLVVFISTLMGLLALASPIAVYAVFSLCAIALDSSYLVPIFCKVVFRDHPEVMFKPGPFTLGRGWFGLIVNWIAILWTLFVVVILSLPQTVPVFASTMNYAAPITAVVMGGSAIWYYAGGRRHYTGPRNIINEERLASNAAIPGENDEGRSGEDVAEKSTV